MSHFNNQSLLHSSYRGEKHSPLTYEIAYNISNDVDAVKILGTLFLELRGISSPQRAGTGLFETVAMFLSVMLYPTA
jgi:hypothetical protein